MFWTLGSSRQSLAALCFSKEAQLETEGRDHYRRTITTVHCAGWDASAKQVNQGMATVFGRYAESNFQYLTPLDSP